MDTEDMKIKAMASAYQEFYATGKILTKCPKCDKTITIKGIGSSSEMKCSCGFMDGVARGL